MKIDLKKVENVVIGFNGTHKDVCDAFVLSADYDGYAMTSDELDDLHEQYPEFIDNIAYENGAVN